MTMKEQGAERRWAEADADADAVDALLAEARATIAACRAQADILLFASDEVEERKIIRRMQDQARRLNEVGDIAPKRRREAELLMGECAKVWTGIMTAERWAWR